MTHPNGSLFRLLTRVALKRHLQCESSLYSVAHPFVVSERAQRLEGVANYLFPCISNHLIRKHWCLALVMCRFFHSIVSAWHYVARNIIIKITKKRKHSSSLKKTAFQTINSHTLPYPTPRHIMNELELESERRMVGGWRFKMRCEDMTSIEYI